MTYSELRYLNAVDKLTENGGVRQIDLSRFLGVSTVSIYKAMARLEEKNYVERNENGLYFLTLPAKEIISEYMPCAKAIEKLLIEKCNSSQKNAQRDAIAVTCSLSDENRKSILNLINK